MTFDELLANIEVMEVRFCVKDGTSWTCRFVLLTGDHPDMILLERDANQNILRQTAWRIIESTASEWRPADDRDQN